MSAAVLWSGGKDSTLALHRSLAAGVPVTTLYNLYDGETERVRFHGVRRELIAAQADALGLRLVQLPTSATSFESVFMTGLRSLVESGIDTLIAGNIHLADVRAWYEERTVAAGLRHAEPLWGEEPSAVVNAVLDLGYRARITGIELARASRDWLGQDLSAALLDKFLHAGIDPAGESGEYHTFVHDGPAFASALSVVAGAEHAAAGFAFVDLTL